MTGTGGPRKQEAPRQDARQQETPPGRRRGWRALLVPAVREHSGGLGTGYTVVSYLLGGIIAYGGIGWLIGRWTGLTHILLPAGMLFGLAVSTGWIIYRYGRSGPAR
jgi:ATP synthase protein I